MVLPTARNSSALIAAPAGNLEKLRTAVKFGADEVYFGGGNFNLRSQSGNFSYDDISGGLKFCRVNGARSTFLLNSYLHENDLGALREFIDELRSFPFDAIMISDPGMLMMLRDEGIKIPLHLSTQMSTLNHLAVRFWASQGIERIVLAREVSLEDIRSIRERTGAELEIFCHGALCISYSGRCLLSRFLSGRDANRGACSHPCRWRYALVEEKRPGNHLEIVEHARGTEILSSKDLCLIERMGEYIEAGVNAFKIEGRMKSLYYTAAVTRVYRHAAAVHAAGGDTGPYLPFWKSELDLVSHRPYTDSLFDEFRGMEFSGVPYIKKAMFMGCSIAPGKDDTEAYVKAFNPVYVNDTLEAIFPITGDVIRDGSFTVKEILDDEKSVDMAQPGRNYLLRFDGPVGPDAVFRRRINPAQGVR